MSDDRRGPYARVIPRDLFNEASLLKCLGKLALILMDRPSSAEFEEDELKADGFRIVQSEGDGAIEVENLPFLIAGHRYRLYRPLNSREPWPLWCESPFSDHDGDDCEVFDAEGNISPVFAEWIAPVT